MREYIELDGKKFHLTPDRTEFLSEVQAKHPGKTVFTIEEMYASVNLDTRYYLFLMDVMYVSVNN